MSIKEFTEAARTNFQVYSTQDCYAVGIEAVDRAYEAAIASLPPKGDRIYGKLLLVCHKHMVSAANLIAACLPEDSAGITRRAAEAAKVATAISLNDDNVQAWLSYHERNERWLKRQSAEKPKVAAGADSNIAAKQGQTALQIAAKSPAGEPAALYLLTKGADPKALDYLQNTTLLQAATGGNLKLARKLISSGVDVNKANAAGFTALAWAAGNGDLKFVRLLLKHGANVNTAKTFGGKVKHGELALKNLTPLMLAAAHSPVEVIDELLRAGAEVNAKDIRGMTPLMLAVSSDRQDIGVVARLLQAGADTGTEDIYGQTALDWALKFRHPKVVSLLGGAPDDSVRQTNTHLEESAADAPTASGKTNSLAAELTQTVALLQNASDSFFKESGCVACHHQNLTAMAVASARAKSLPINEKQEQELVKTTQIAWASLFKHGMLVRDDPPGGVDMTLYVLWSLAAENVPASDLTDTMVQNIAVQQWPDGRWDLSWIARAPLTEGPYLGTAKAIYLLDRYTPAGTRPRIDAQISRARKWLIAHPSPMADEQAMRLVGLKWSKAPQAEIAKAAGALRKRQRSDGGWGSNEHLPSDPYATAKAIYALKTANYSSGDTAILKGVDYLRRTRKSDGSWHVASRAPKFQPYFESGFPYGHDQWMSVSATAWAATALAESIPTPVQPGHIRLRRVGQSTSPLPAMLWS